MAFFSARIITGDGTLETHALGSSPLKRLDETSFVRLGPRHARTFATTVADVQNHPDRRDSALSGLRGRGSLGRGLAQLPHLRRTRYVLRLRRRLLGGAAEGDPGGRPLPPRALGQQVPRRRAPARAVRAARTPRTT